MTAPVGGSEGGPGPVRTVLHIGSDKTGTTSLQAALAASRRELAQVGVWYPDLDGRPDHRLLARSGGPRHLDAPDGCHTLVLSSEALWPLDRHGIEAVLRRLPAGPVTVVGFVRRPSEFAEAAFLQRCQRAGSPAALRALVGLRRLPGPINPIGRRAVGRLSQLERWADQIEEGPGTRRSGPSAGGDRWAGPGGAVVVAAYRSDLDIVDAFCRAADLDTIAPVLAGRSLVRRNPGLGLVAVEASVVVAARAGRVTQRRFLDELAESTPPAESEDRDRPDQPPPLLPARLRRRIDEEAHPRISRLHERLGGLEALLASPPSDPRAVDGPLARLDRAGAEALIERVWPGFLDG